MSGLAADYRSRRSAVNQRYMLRALIALREDPDHKTRWPWLAPVGGDLPRRIVLYELGRIDDPEEIRWLADRVGQGRFTAVEAVRRIRAYRLDQEILPPADADELAGLLVKTINQYGATHDGQTWQLIEEALRLLGPKPRKGRSR